MAKRYHQSKKDRSKEHAGMETYERGPIMKRMKKADSYGSHSSSDKTMKSDSYMVRDDWSARSLCPESVKQVAFPKAPYGPYTHVDDLFTGVQDSMNADSKAYRRIMKPSK